jgi:hypothetical protein
MEQYHEIITNAVTGEVTEIIRDWTPEEIAAQEANKVILPTISSLQAQLNEISIQLQALQGSN